MDRRDALWKIPALAAIPSIGISGNVPTQQKGKQSYKHSVCRWCFSQMPLDQLCDVAKSLGIHAIDLLSPSEWDTALKKGLDVSLSNGSSLGITKGFNDPQHHSQLQKELIDIIPKASEKGIAQVIVFSGNSNFLNLEEGLENCAVGLEPVVKVAEKYNVRLVMELLNSKIDHADYQCDHTHWGVKLVNKVGSSNFKLLYDIYHMQIMEGDVIRTITDFKDYFSHYHTAGVPGRHEINDTQELFYPAIMQAIHATGFKGYVAQEFIPTGSDPVQSLRDAIRICTLA